MVAKVIIRHQHTDPQTPRKLPRISIWEIRVFINALEASDYVGYRDYSVVTNLNICLLPLSPRIEQANQNPRLIEKRHSVDQNCSINGVSNLNLFEFDLSA